jgi:hypothetical protein
MKDNDPVRPSHYHPKDSSGIHCHHTQRAALGARGFEDYIIGCAMKYLFRWRSKNGIEDLEKARECIRLAIESHKEATHSTQDQPEAPVRPTRIS